MGEDLTKALKQSYFSKFENFLIYFCSVNSALVSVYYYHYTWITGTGFAIQEFGIFLNPDSAAAWPVASSP